MRIGAAGIKVIIYKLFHKKTRIYTKRTIYMAIQEIAPLQSWNIEFAKLAWTGFRFVGSREINMVGCADVIPLLLYHYCSMPSTGWCLKWEKSDLFKLDDVI